MKRLVIVVLALILSVSFVSAGPGGKSEGDGTPAG